MIFPGAYYVGATLTNCAWGVVCDRCGYRRPLVLSLFLVSAATAGFVTSASLPAAIAWRVAGGAFDGVRTITRAAVGHFDVASGADDRQRSRHMATLMLGTAVGFAVGPIAAGRLTGERLDRESRSILVHD